MSKICLVDATLIYKLEITIARKVLPPPPPAFLHHITDIST